jgi:diketogulonate reductase-like aldo/keto reductase
VGKAISDALTHGIVKNREEIFVTTKQWREYHGYDASLKCLELSLERLGLDYVDCWMMHWPGPCWESKERQPKECDIQTGKRALDDDQDDLWSRAKSGMGKDEIASLRAETWRAMEDAYKSGKARSIAVSNFTIHHLETLKQSATLWPPAINQIELHPYYQQRELVEYCRKEGIVIQAYASLGGQDGTKAKWKVLGGKLLESPPVLAASKRLSSPKRRITPAQILLRWALQQNIAIVPKTASPSRMAENANLFDFELSEDDMEAISKLGDGVDGDEGRICWRTEPLRMLDFE